MAKTTDLRDGYNLARKKFADKGRQYELEVSISSPKAIANSLMNEYGVFPNSQMKIYYDKYSTGNWEFQSSCGQVTTYLRDSILNGNWTEMIDNKRGTVGLYKAKQQCYKWIKDNVLAKTGYFGVLLGCHSFTLSIFDDKVRIYQAYMAVGFGGYNFTKCINKDEEFKLSDFKAHIKNVILLDNQQSANSAGTLFYGTCSPYANCSNKSLVNLSVFERQGSHPSIATIRDNFNEFKKSQDRDWALSMNMSVKKCALIQSKKGRGSWTEDSHGVCEVCGGKVRKFTRHHCRVCGKLICGSTKCKKKLNVLSSKRKIKKEVSATVCVNCFNTFNYK